MTRYHCLLCGFAQAVSAILLLVWPFGINVAGGTGSLLYACHAFRALLTSVSCFCAVLSIRARALGSAPVCNLLLLLLVLFMVSVRPAAALLLFPCLPAGSVRHCGRKFAAVFLPLRHMLP